MLRFIARRILQAALTVFVVVTLTFLLIRLAPGDPAVRLTERPNASPETIERARRELGVDKPIYTQYRLYIGKLVSGDLGTSFALGQSVTTVLKTTLPNTIVLGTAALIINFLLGIVLGTIQGMRPGSLTDRSLSVATLTLYCTPVFWLGIILLLVFGQTLEWLPVAGARDPVVYAQLSFPGRMWDRVTHLLMPALTLGLVMAAVTARYQRAALIEVLGQDFLRTARAKGLDNKTIVWKHALKTSLLPTITLLGLSLPVLLSGSVLVETVFAWPGMGRLLADSMFRRDYPVITGTVLVGATIVVLGNLLTDLLYWWLDPRTRRTV